MNLSFKLLCLLALGFTFTLRLRAEDYHPASCYFSQPSMCPDSTPTTQENYSTCNVQFAPDILVAAKEKLNLPAQSLLMVGDTPYDIEAANRIEMKAIAFRSGGWDDAPLAGAVDIFDGPWDLFAHFESAFLEGVRAPV